MPKKIDPALRERAVRLVREQQSEYPSRTVASAAVARQVGVGNESVRRWVLQADIDDGTRRGGDQRSACRGQTTQGGEQSPAGGRRDPEGGDDFRRGGTRPPQPLMLGFIDMMRAEGHAVESIFRVLREQGVKIAARTYRAHRQGVVASRGAVDRAMRALGFSGIRRDKGVRTTIPAKDGISAGDLLNRDFTAPRPRTTPW